MTLSIISLALAVISAIIIAFDLHKNPQSMRIMNAVWILTALWSSIVGLIAYFAFGREKSMQMGEMNRVDMSKEMKMSGSMNMPHRPKWQSITLSTLHCGAGCTLADIIGSIFLLFMPITLFGSTLVGGWFVTYILALIIGVYFQFRAISEMSDLPASDIVRKAIKADFLSLTAWQVGMYGWIYLLMFHFKYLAPHATLTWDFWFAMQQAMLAGFVLALPINYALILSGIKRGM
ncbi:MAG: DUF4396 domain-containing protein [Rikenellaceae bacterium]